MIQAQQKSISFDEFIKWLPEASSYRYELHHGAVVEMPKPRGKHSKISGDLVYHLVLSHLFIVG
ncbi:MAG: Uma2 family endonuclease [Cyanobacteria bacterium P01_F01_bin.86]